MVFYMYHGGNLNIKIDASLDYLWRVRCGMVRYRMVCYMYHGGNINITTDASLD